MIFEIHKLFGSLIGARKFLFDYILENVYIYTTQDVLILVQLATSF